MFKSQMPAYICSTALSIVVLSPGYRHPAPLISGKNTFYIPNSRSVKSINKKMQISMTAPDKRAMKFVHSYIKSNDRSLYDVKERSMIPFTIIDSVFNHYGLPLELKYLAVVESELKSSALSPVGARGPWQLMPVTAHILGLQVNRHADERLSYYKSTRAAARYLRDLYGEFGNWLLVLAAYNAGPGAVCSAMHKSHSKNFWMLQQYLPAESRIYVKKFIATDYYFEGTAGKNKLVKREKNPVSKSSKSQERDIKESANEKFNRLMNESAKSLRKSNELLDKLN